MKLKNHYKMGHMICNNMTENGIPLEKVLFKLGNLVPDILMTYAFNKHSHQKCASRLEKLLKRIYAASPSNRFVFSYYSGVAAHYICDFLCYAHTSVFSGSLRDHLTYEKYQSFVDTDMLPFYKLDSMHYSLAELICALDERISKRVQLLSRNAEMSFSDIPIAINIASWATSAAYFYNHKYPQHIRHIELHTTGRKKTA